MSRKDDNPYTYPYQPGSPDGVLGDMPPQRTAADTAAQVFFGCGAVEPYEGVTDGPYYGQRSATDKWMQKTYGCASRENYGASTGQKKSSFPIERYCSSAGCGAGGNSCDCSVGNNCPFARTSDIPSNPYNKYARNVVLK